MIFEDWSNIYLIFYFLYQTIWLWVTILILITIFRVFSIYSDRKRIFVDTSMLLRCYSVFLLQILEYSLLRCEGQLLNVTFSFLNALGVFGGQALSRSEFLAVVSNNADLRIPLHATTHDQKFIRYRAIKTWNNLTDNLHSSSSFYCFKTKLKLMLTLETE